jgi:phosphoribosyl 1,2-cyclic phosphate phosphodiesterase
LRWADVIGPNRVILTHMNATMDYAELSAELPAGVEPGYDGLEVIA